MVIWIGDFRGNNSGETAKASTNDYEMQRLGHCVSMLDDG